MVHVPLFLSNAGLSKQIYHYSNLSSVASAKSQDSSLLTAREGYFFRSVCLFTGGRVSLVTSGEGGICGGVGYLAGR